MPFDLEWNGDAIVGALEEPFHQANEVLGRAFANEITAEKWEWPTQPSPRDIVDTGELRRDYKGERQTQGADPAHDHTWSMEYAMAVHEGADLANGARLPARPWTKKPTEDGVLEEAFEKLAAGPLGRIT